jgi:hypothetical protein
VVETEASRIAMLMLLEAVWGLLACLSSAWARWVAGWLLPSWPMKFCTACDSRGCASMNLFCSISTSATAAAAQTHSMQFSTRQHNIPLATQTRLIVTAVMVHIGAASSAEQPPNRYAAWA